MAEVILAAPAAIAALLQLADYGTRLASTLYRTAQSAAAAEQELDSLARRILFFSTSVRVARTALNRHCAEYPTSPVVLFIEHHRVLRDVKRGSKFIRRRLADAENRLRGIHSNSALWMKIKWVLKRSSFLELLPELDGFQANLNLLVSVASLEALNCLKQSGAAVSEEERLKLEDECSSLRSSIKTLVKTIDRLEIQLDRLNRPREEQNKGVNSARWQSQGQCAPLIQLGRSMYRSGVVPDIDPPLPTPAISERGFGPHPMSRDSSCEVQEDEVTHLSSSPIAQASSIDSAPLPDDDGSFAPKDGCPPPQHPPMPSLTTSYDSGSAPHRTGTSLKDSSAARILHVGREYNTSSTSGYVMSSRGEPQSATAVINGSLDGNVISLKEVVTLGLVARPFGGTSGGVVNMVFGPSNIEKSVGKVTLQWTMDIHPNKRYPPLTVECEVSESCQTGLIFGRPFLDARRRLWPP